MIEVAIVRPGPIQGDMVHPYSVAGTARRSHRPENYATSWKPVVSRYLEQAMKIAIIAGGFTPPKRINYAALWPLCHRNDPYFRGKLINGMVANGYEADFAAVSTR